MKKLVLTVLIGLILSTPMVTSQTSGFSQRGKVSLGLRADGLFIGHSSLPIRSKAMMVNPLTGKEVEVTVMRNIPASTDRIADISTSVWQELGLVPEQDVRIYTSAAPRPQIAALPVADNPQEFIAEPQEPVAEIVQTGTPSAQQPYAVPSPLGTPGYDNLPPGIKFENNNNFIINGFPGAMPDSAMSAGGYGGTQGQAAQPYAGYDTRGQAAQPAGSYGTQGQTAQPSAANDAWARPAQPAAANDTWARPAQPAASYETRTQTAQPSAANDAWARPAQPATANDTWTRPAQPAAVSETRTQTAQPASAVNDNWARAVMPAAVSEPRPQQAASIVITETHPQQAAPAAAKGTQAQQAPVIPTVKPVAPVETRTRPQRPGLIIETTPQTANSAVIIDAPKATQIIEITTPQEFPGLPALPAIWE